MHPPIGPAPAAVRRALLCRTGELRMAFPIESIREITRPLPLQPLKGLPPYLLGATLLRGVPVPVIASGPLLTGGAGPPAGRYVILKAGERSVAFAVESVDGFRDLPPETFTGLPPLLGSAGDSTISTLGSLDSDLVVTLETARMVPGETWGMIGSNPTPPPLEPPGVAP